MAVVVRLTDPHDVARIVDALLVAALAAEADLLPLLARRYVAIANDIGDALDQSAVPAYPA